MESTSERDTFISSPSTQNSNNPLYKWLNSISFIVCYQKANIKTNNKTWKGYISLLPYIYLLGDRKKMVFGFEFSEVAMILSPITTSCALIHVAALYLTCGLTLLTDISEK